MNFVFGLQCQLQMLLGTLDSAEVRLKAWLRVGLVLAWSTMACGFSNELSGPDQSGREDQGNIDAPWPLLPLLVELQEVDFPQSQTFVILGNDHWTQSRIQIDANTPVKIQVEASSPAAQKLVDERSNQISRYAGENALVPLAPRGVVLMQFASRTVELGSEQAFVTSEFGEFGFAVNSDDSRIVWKVHIAWGQPWVEFDPGLEPLSLSEESGEAFLPEHILDAATPWSEVGDCRPGDRFRIRHRSRLKEQAPSTNLDDLKHQQILSLDRSDQLHEKVEFREFAPDSVFIRVGQGLARQVFLGEDTYFHCGSGGQIGIRINRRMVDTLRGPTFWSNMVHEVALDRFARLGTMIELLPWRAFGRIRSKQIKFRQQKFHKTKVRVRAGDLLRVEVRGNLQSTGADENVVQVPLEGGIDHVAEEGERGELDEAGKGTWLVPGGRVLANYLRIGDSLIELDGDDVLYAPTDGTVYVGVNTCETSENLRAADPCLGKWDWSAELDRLRGERTFVIAVRREP